MATTSSGFTPLWAGSRPKNSAPCAARGHARHAADEHDLLSMATLQPASRARAAGSRVRSTRSAHEALELASRLSVRDEVERAAAASVAMNGRLISVSSDDESSCLAFSAASLRRWSAGDPCGGRRRAPSRTRRRGVDDALVEVLAAEVRVAVGAHHVEDAGAISRIEMSNVPPPRS
jgi:hypothetical protein